MREGHIVFGRTLELRRAVHRSAVKIGFVGAVAQIVLFCCMVAVMEAALPGGHVSIAFARSLVPIFAVLAVVCAAVTVFASPLVFRYFSRLAASMHDTAGVFTEEVHSDNAYERAAGQLGLLAIAQMFAAAIPTALGFCVFVAGAHVSVFSVFVALSVVILAAVCPRTSEWDDEVDRLVAHGYVRAETLEDSAA